MMIKAEDISKSFEKLKALDMVNLNVNKGSIYGLIGSNGAGKTTLLKTLVGIYKQDKGKAYISGEEVFENIEKKAKLMFIPDTLYFFPQFSIKDMAKFYKSIYSSWDAERYEILKATFNIEENKKIHRLSKGMQKQVAIWLALCVKPDIMVLDEPFDGLDPVMRKKIKNLLIQDVADKEMTILISSHNLRELEDFCDNIGILHEGKLLVQMELDDLKSDIHKIQVAFKENIPEELLADANVLYKEIRGSVKLYIVRGKKDELIQKIMKYEPAILDVLPLSLEEIFIYEMGDVGYEIKNIII